MLYGLGGGCYDEDDDVSFRGLLQNLSSTYIYRCFDIIYNDSGVLIVEIFIGRI